MRTVMRQRCEIAVIGEAAISGACLPSSLRYCGFRRRATSPLNLSPACRPTDDDLLAVLDAAGEDHLRQRVLHDFWITRLSGRAP